MLVVVRVSSYLLYVKEPFESLRGKYELQISRIVDFNTSSEPFSRTTANEKKKHFK